MKELLKKHKVKLLALVAAVGLALGLSPELREHLLGLLESVPGLEAQEEGDVAPVVTPSSTAPMETADSPAAPDSQ